MESWRIHGAIVLGAEKITVNTSQSGKSAIFVSGTRTEAHPPQGGPFSVPEVFLTSPSE